MSKKAVKENKVHSPVADMSIVVKDKQGTEWYSKLTKEQFTKHCQDDYSVQVFDQTGEPVKKYRKGYLTFVSEFEKVLKNEPKKIALPIIDTNLPDLDPEDIGQALALADAGQEDAGQVATLIESAESNVIIDSDGEVTIEDITDDTSQEALLKEDQLHIVDTLEEKEIE